MYMCTVKLYYRGRPLANLPYRALLGRKLVLRVEDIGGAFLMVVPSKMQPDSHDLQGSVLVSTISLCHYERNGNHVIVSSAACAFLGGQSEKDWGSNAPLGGASAEGRGSPRPAGCGWSHISGIIYIINSVFDPIFDMALNVYIIYIIQMLTFE